MIAILSRMRWRSLLLSLVPVLWAVTAGAQSSAQLPRREIPGHDFSPNGVWRGRVRKVRANRARLLAARQFSALNARPAAPLPPSAALTTVVSGSVVEPVILFKFRDTPGGAVRGDSAAYDSVLYATTPPSGRPYTVRTYYQQLSTINTDAPLMTITGTAFSFVTLDSNEVYYAGAAGTCTGNPFGTSNCNGLFSFSAYTHMQGGLREALAKLDGRVDWTQFTSHGDTLDLVVFAHSAKDGACGGYSYPNPTQPSTSNNHLWSHRDVLQTPYVTHSTGPGGKRLTVVDYILESAVGGASACDTTQIMPVGTVAHETGHGFDLPDLYDTQGSSEGVGEYSLMGSGNYTSPFSPSRMDAWSLSQLGWVNVAPLTARGSYQFSSAGISDTVFYVRPTGSNPRGEYFLIENREGVQSDSSMIHFHCQVWYNSASPPPCGGGLLIYHIDSTQVANHGFTAGNAVNAGPIPGVAVIQADGRGDLDAGRNRGDAGDLYPCTASPLFTCAGTTVNTALSVSTNPRASKNVDQSFAGFAVDSIRAVAATMAFRLRFGQPSLIRATDTLAVVQVDAKNFTVFRDLLDSGSVHTIGIADTQFTSSGRTRDVFVSWNIGGANPRSFTMGAAPDTIIANVASIHQLTYTGSSSRVRVTASPVVDTSGIFLAQGTPVTLTAQAESGAAFAGWTGDTTSPGATLVLNMAHPYSVTANVAGPYTLASLVAALVGNGILTTVDLNYLDQSGNKNGQFDVGDFLAWVKTNGATPTAPVRHTVRKRT